MKKTIIWVVAVIVTMIYGGLAVGWVHRNDNPTRTADQTGLKTYSPLPHYWQLRCGYNNKLEDCGAEARTVTKDECLLLVRRMTDKYGWKDEQYDCIARY